MSHTISLKGKVVLVTGATSGIGMVTARALAAMGAETVLVGRDSQKTAIVVSAIRSSTGNEQIHGLVADLSSQVQVREMAAAFCKQYDRLDVLIHNVGAWFETRQLSADGIEMNFALNHLSHFLLTYLLLEPLQAAKPARVINVASEAHRGVRLNFSDLQNARKYSARQAYGQSKLANLFFTYGLAATLTETEADTGGPGVTAGITVNALHPGTVATNFHHRDGTLGWLLGKLFRTIAITPEEGALTSIYLASAPEVAGITGKYFFKNQAVPSSHVSYSMDTARKLWDCSQELVGISYRI